MEKVLHGDNLELMRDIESESIDLIYMDPPYNSGKDYEDFDDRWESLDSYLEFMVPRITEARGLLKWTGTLYLQCDQHVIHPLKCEMDKIFGVDNFRNEIIWQRSVPGRDGKRKPWPHTYDTILFYSRSDSYYLERLYKPLTKDQTKRYRNVEPGTNRLYAAVQLGGYSEKSIEQMEKDNLIHVSRNGKKYKKYYLDEAKSMVGNIWTDLPGFNVRSNANERTDYPTQKPMALLERIIEASSQEQDIILDPFCGSGTTLVVARSLNRKFIGIDKNERAIQITNDRLANMPPPNKKLTLF